MSAKLQIDSITLTCIVCRGKGKVWHGPSMSMVKCDKCNGYGRYTVDARDKNGLVEIFRARVARHDLTHMMSDDWGVSVAGHADKRQIIELAGVIGDPELTNSIWNEMVEKFVSYNSWHMFKWA